MRTVPGSQPFRLPPGPVWSAPRTLKLPTRNPVAGVVWGTDMERAATGAAAGSTADAEAGPASGAAGATSRAVASVRPTAQRRRTEVGREEAVVPGMEGASQMSGKWRRRGDPTVTTPHTSTTCRPGSDRCDRSDSCDVRVHHG